MSHSFELTSADATAELAGYFARHARRGDCILLDGPVGSGKTHFARSFIQNLLARSGAVEDVPSPTYTLVQTYDTAAGEVWHADLYRLSALDEVTELGLEEAFDRAIVLVEWPDRLGPLLPHRRLELEFGTVADPEARSLRVRSIGAGWDWLHDAPHHD